MKRIYSILFSFLGVFVLTQNSFAQCTMIPVSLADISSESGAIAEGTITGKKSFWNIAHTMIYTRYTLQVSRWFKGGNAAISVVDFYTEGGTVNYDRIDIHPNFEGEIGEQGIVFLKNASRYYIPANERGSFSIFEITAAEQGFYCYADNMNSISNPFEKYTDPESSFVPELNRINGTLPWTVGQIKPQMISGRRATPTLTSFSPTTITAGTSSVLTIKGKNFGSTQGTGKVEFKNGNDGGATYTAAASNHYVSWTDTQIKVMVPTLAGTGTIKVTNSDPASVTSSASLTVSWSHINATYTGGTQYEVQLQGDNGKGGNNWKFNRRFYDSTKAKIAFITSLEKWRCGSLVNWDTSGVTSIDTTGADGVTVITWDFAKNLPTGVLGRCYSYFSGCFVGPNIFWWVTQYDIIFKGNYTWNFGPGATTGGKMDFISVATHELGHGNQLGHVINTSDVMHYSIGPNTDKRTLNANNLTGGRYVVNKSSTVPSCSSIKAMVKLDSNSCGIPRIYCSFGVSKTAPCLAETISFRDSSTGNISAWSWNFGSNASPATATGKGPHSVKYSTSGQKTISLTITTTNGNRSRTKTNYVTVGSDSSAAPNFTFSDIGGSTAQFNNTTPNGNSFTWDFGDSDTSGRTQKNPKHTFPGPGTYNVKLTATNGCNSNFITKQVTITSAPSIAKFVLSKIFVCLKDTLTIIDSCSGAISSYSWNFGTDASPASSASSGTQKVVYSSGGSKTITLTLQTPAGQKTFQRTVNVAVHQRCWADFTYINTQNGVQFTNASFAAAGSTWKFGDGQTSTSVSPLHLFASNGTYNTKLIVSNTCNTDSITKQVVATADTTAPNFTADKLAPCRGDNVIFSDSTVGPVISYSWNFGSGASPATATGKGPHTVQYSSGGQKSVTLSLSTPTGNRSKTRSNYITVNTDARTTASFSYSNMGSNIIQFNNLSSNGSSFKWHFGTGDSSAAASPQYRYPSSAGFTVKLSSSNNCNTDDTTVTLPNWTGISDLHKNIFSLYPNPASGSIRIEWNSAASGELRLTDYTGRLIRTFTAEPGTNDVSLTGIKPGRYMLSHQASGFVTYIFINE